MKAHRSKIWVTAALGLATLAAGCGGDDEPSTPDARPADNTPDASSMVNNTVRLTAPITSDTTWTADKTYVLAEYTPVYVKNNATLTIEPGTVIKGEMASTLVITRGAKIKAEGTKDKPIVFTSAQADGRKTKGYWGGVLVLGKAPTNDNKVPGQTQSEEANFEAFATATGDGKYGGSDPNDDSGVIKYVRIEFAGFAYNPDREFNNLTLCAVGSKTVVDFVQVHAGSDDGIELFGGTVNVKHIVSTQNQDDGFDTDNGWSGKAQFIVIQNVDPQFGSDASNGYESDNHAPMTTGDAAAGYVADPRTLPTVYNVTVIGKPLADTASVGQGHFAGVFRRGTGGRYFNHLFVNFRGGFSLRDDATINQIKAGNLFVKNSMFFKFGTAASFWLDTDGKAKEENVFMLKDVDSLHENVDWFNKIGDPKLPAEATSAKTPSFKPAADSEALKKENAAIPMNEGASTFFDVDAQFVGAVGADDWTTGWTAYPQPFAGGF